MNIEGKLVTLRAVEVEDLELLNKWSNSPELWKNLAGWHFPYSKMNTQNWIQGNNNNDTKDQIFAINTKEHGIIGTASLHKIDWKNRNAFHGMMLGDKETRGKGYAQDAVMAIMRFAFEELGLQRLDGCMIAYNKRSIKFYTEKCGWEIEGIKKDWFYKNGAFHDQVVVGITRSMYKNFCEEHNYWGD